MKLTAKMLDLSKVATGLSAAEQQECRLAGLRQKEIAALGPKYICHLANAPVRGQYHPTTGVRLA